MSLVKYGRMAAKRYPAVRKRYNVYAPAVKQLASDVMYLKGLVNAEPKSHVVNTSGNHDYNGTVYSLCGIAQGDGSNNRDGNRILPRYLSLYIHVNQIAATAGHSRTTHRMIIFRYWGENPNATPSVTATDVLSVTGTQYSPVSHLNDKITGPRGDRTRRIEILRNEFFTLDTVSNTSKDFQYNIEMNGKSKNNKEHIEFRSSVFEDPISGGVYILYTNDNATATDQGIWIGSRLTFYDN